MIGARVGIYISKGGFDADAKAYMLATGVPNNGTVYNASTAAEKTGAELWTLINNTVIELKDNGVGCPNWIANPGTITIPQRVIYPWLDASSSSISKWNLADPRDLDAAYRATFHGGLTFDDMGITGDGASGRIQTKYGWGGGGDGELLNYSIGFICLDATAGASDYLLYGLQNSTFRISWDNYSTNRSFVVNGSSSGVSVTINPNSKMKDMSTCTRTANNLGYILNGDTVNTQTATISPGVPSVFSEIPLLVTFSPPSTYSLYSNQTIGAGFIGKGLTSAQALTLRTIFRDYEIARGRY